MRALHTAATGMMAQELNVQVISNNIANMRTSGYKRQRAEFQDLLYEHVSRVGHADLDPGQHPAGRHRTRRRRAHRRHPAGDDAGHAPAHRQHIRPRHPRRRFLQDRDAGRHLHLYPRRLVPDGRAGPHRHAAGQRVAARHHRPAELDRDHHQPAGPGLGDRPGLGHADRARPDHADPLRQQGRPAGDRRQPVRRDAGLRHAAGRRRRPPTASATCSRATSSRPMSRR